MDYNTERYKLTHRLQGIVNAMGDDITELLEGCLEKVSGKILLLSAKAEKTESIIRKKKYLGTQKLEIEKVLDEIYDDIGKGIIDKTVEVAEGIPKIVAGITEKSFPGVTINVGIPTLKKSQVLAWFESSQIEGLFFNDWLKKLETNAVSRIMTASRKGLILHEPVRTVAKEIQNALNVSRKSATGLAHNAIFQATNYAEREYHRENKRLVAFDFNAELDRKTTPLCRSLDQKRFRPPETAPVPPLHWKCRSHLSPVFKGYEHFKPTKRIARIDTEPRTVKHRDGTTSTTYKKLRVKFPPGEMSYNDWMLSMVKSKDARDVSFAREALGRTRFNFVSSGKLKMDSLYYHGKLRTIKQLEELMK